MYYNAMSTDELFFNYEFYLKTIILIATTTTKINANTFLVEKLSQNNVASSSEAQRSPSHQPGK